MLPIKTALINLGERLVIWFLKMLIEVPSAVLSYRRDYYNSKKITKVVKKTGIVEGFYLHDEIFGATMEEWVVLCEYLHNNGKDIPQSLVDFAINRGWVSTIKKEETTSQNKSWEEWENE